MLGKIFNGLTECNEGVVPEDLVRI